MWSAAQRWAVRIGGLVTVAVLARLLTPADFGLVAVAMAFVPLLFLLADLGFSTYVVQAQEESAPMVNTAFWYALTVGALLTAAMMGVAPLVAATFGLPGLTPVLLGMAPSVLLVAVSSVPIALLRRRLAFRALAMQSFAAAAVGQVAAIVLALLGFGVWALVVQLLVNQAIGAVCAWTSSRFRPQWMFSPALFRTMLGFGANVVGVELIAMIRTWAETAIITAVLGVARLGSLTIAQRLVQATQDLSGAAILPVSTVVFAQIRSSPERLAAAYRTALETLYAIVVPMLVGVAVAAPLLIPLMFGAQWQASIGPSQALAVAGILTLGAMLDHGLFYGLGRPGRWLAYALVVDGLTVAVTALTAPYGLTAVTWGFVAVAGTATILRWVLVSRLLGISVWASAQPFLRAAVAAALGSAAAFATLVATATWPPVVSVAATAIAIITVHAIMIRLVLPEAFAEVVSIASRLIPARLRRRAGGLSAARASDPGEGSPE